MIAKLLSIQVSEPEVGVPVGVHVELVSQSPEAADVIVVPAGQAARAVGAPSPANTTTAKPVSGLNHFVLVI